jgi:two-component system NtrC family sensor kinase
LLVPLAATVAVVLIVHALIGYWSVRDQATRFVRADLERSTVLIESALHDGMLLNHMNDVQNRMERLGTSAGIVSIRVYSKNGKIALSADPIERGTVVDVTADACVACHPSGRLKGSGVLSHRTVLHQQDGGDVQRRLAVIPNEPSCSVAGCHPSPAQTPVLGVLDVRMTSGSLDAAIAGARRQIIIATASLIPATGLVAALFIRRLVHDPVTRLHEGTRRIAAGDLSTRIDIRGRHELASLADAFNAMVADLRTARVELDAWSNTLEEKVRRKTEELARAQQQMSRVETMASLGKLCATVVHELNNPLSGVLAYARLVRRELAEQPLPPATREEIDGYLALVDKECVRCGAIVKNLLTFARGSGVRLASVDLNQIVEHTLMLVRHHLELHNVHVETTPLEGDSTIVADSGQIQQACLALIMNAIEAMQGVQARARVLGVRLTGDEDSVCIRITDTGVGIAPELIPHIFEPFVTTKGETSGVGLGLAVVYGIVLAHCGDIAVDSQPGTGTTFTLTLPRRSSLEQVQTIAGAATDGACGAAGTAEVRS